MIKFLFRRMLTMAMTLFIISALVFFIIKLPPGDFLTNQIAELRAQGEAASAAKAEFLIRQYGLDRPVWTQYRLFAERLVVAAVNRLEQLVSLFEHERLQRVDRLLAIPRAAIRRPERRDDLHKTGELLRSA